jgi:Flp pilus assembly protein TadD
MMKSGLRPTILLVLAGLFILGTMGCASSPNRQQSVIQASEYRKIIERQRAEMAAEQKAAQKVPELNADGYEMLGDRYISQGNSAQAFIQYAKSLEMDPTRQRVRYKIGTLYLERGLKDEAKKEFQEILKADPENGAACEGMGRVYFQSGEYGEAEKNFHRAIQINPSLWQAFNHLGVLYDRQGNYDEAITQYQKAIALQPNLGFLYNNLGVSLLLKGEHEKAVAAFTEAVKLKTSNPKIYNNLALGLSKLDRYPEALEAFKKGSDEATAHYNLGCLYMARGKTKEAIQAFEKAIEMKPGFYVQAHQKMKRAREALSLQDTAPQPPPGGLRF